jgi:hypothetical protein
MSAPGILKHGGRAKPHDAGVIITPITAIRQWPYYILIKQIFISIAL